MLSQEKGSLPREPDSNCGMWAPLCHPGLLVEAQDSTNRPRPIRLGGRFRCMAIKRFHARYSVLGTSGDFKVRCSAQTHPWGGFSLLRLGREYPPVMTDHWPFRRTLTWIVSTVGRGSWALPWSPSSSTISATPQRTLAVRLQSSRRDELRSHQRSLLLTPVQSARPRIRVAPRTWLHVFCPCMRTERQA